MGVTKSMDDLYSRANISKTQLDEMASKNVSKDSTDIEKERKQINEIMSAWDRREPSSQGTLSNAEFEEANQPGVNDDDVMSALSKPSDGDVSRGGRSKRRRRRHNKNHTKKGKKKQKKKTKRKSRYHKAKKTKKH